MNAVSIDDILPSDSAGMAHDAAAMRDIMQEVNRNGGTGGGGGGYPSGMPGPGVMMPTGGNPNTTLPMQMDPRVAGAHVIGQHPPSQAEINAMVRDQHYVGYSPHPYAAMGNGMSGKDSFSVQEFRLPLIVAAIVFAFSTPMLNQLIFRVAPALFSGDGYMSWTGMAVKGAAAGALFYLYGRAFPNGMGIAGIL
jgi:hypothetical protein